MNAKTKATAFAILAAALYAVNIPLSKLLLTWVSPTMLAAFCTLELVLVFSCTGCLPGKRCRLTV